MFIENLNLNLIRVFESVCRHRSMTKAAGELHLTQSGVSQNIKNLEDLLGIALFDRVKGRPVPTPKGAELYTLVKGQLHDLEMKLSTLTGEELTLKGEIKMGIPIEYGNMFVLPLAAKFGMKHPKINFEFFYGHASQVNQMLLNGDLDLAIVDSFGRDSQIESFEVGFEIHTLCASMEYLESKKVKNIIDSKVQRKILKELDFIAYLPKAPVLSSWFKHHFPKYHFDGHIRATLMDVQGVGALIRGGLGVGVLPQHLVKRYIKQGSQLYVFEGRGKPLYNSLSMALAKGRTLTPAIEEFILELRQGLESR